MRKIKMTVNLIHVNNNFSSNDAQAVNWAQLTAISPDALVELEGATVTEVAKLIDGARLSNGAVACAYPLDEDDCMTSYVPDFGPSLLAEDLRAQVRETILADKNGELAVRLFDQVASLGLKIRLAGKEFIAAHIVAVNWEADDIEINRCKSNMVGMFDDLEISANAGEEISLDVFEAAVEKNGLRTDSNDRLKAFIACAKRNNATHVYWA